SQARLTGCRLVDAQVCEFDTGDEPVFLVPARLVHLVRPGRLGIGAGRFEELAKGIDGHPGRDLARRMAAHPVRDEIETLLVDDLESVFVVSPLHADVGLAGYEDT